MRSFEEIDDTRRLMALELFVRTYGVPVEVQWFRNNPNGDIYDTGRGIKLNVTKWIYFADRTSSLHFANDCWVRLAN